MRGRIAQWLHWESAHWQSVLAARLAVVVGHRLLPGLPVTLEARLGAGPYLVEAGLSIADFSVAGMTTYFQVAGFPFERRRPFAERHARMAGLPPAWRSTADPL